MSIQPKKLYYQKCPNIALLGHTKIQKKLDGVAALIADPPPLQIHQYAKYTPSVKWP